MSKGKRQQIIIAGPDFEEGPHSNMKEDEFYDAIDSTLDTLEKEEERRVKAFESLTKLPELKPVSNHRLSDEIERIVQEHLKFDLVDDLNSNVWELLASDGEMRVFRRELEENGIVLDPLKAVHSVKVSQLEFNKTIKLRFFYSEILRPMDFIDKKKTYIYI